MTECHPDSEVTPCAQMARSPGSKRRRQMKFFLGLHQPNWLADHRLAGTPVFVSAARLRRASPPQAKGPVIIDSGGSLEVLKYGQYRQTAREYALEVTEWHDQLGNLEAVATQDWMCEDDALAKTGLSVKDHQERTVQSWFDLTEIAPQEPWMPVLQGYSEDDYHRCWEMYEARGVNLAQMPRVALGSVCKRQGTKEAVKIIRGLYTQGLHNLHAFGFKVTGLKGQKSASPYLKSADSMVWSWAARNAWLFERKKLCDEPHPNGCNNCLSWAIQWRNQLVEVAEVPWRVQRMMF